MIEHVENTCEESVWTSSSYTVLSCQSKDGTVLNEAVLPCTMTLKPVGSATTNTLDTNLCPKVTFDFSLIYSDPINPTLDFFIHHPHGTVTVNDGSGGNNLCNTYLGPAGITPMTPEDFKQTIIDVTGQRLPAGLSPPSFGQNTVSLDVSAMDNKFHNTLIGDFSKYIKQELFFALCPGLNNNPI